MALTDTEILAGLAHVARTHLGHEGDLRADTPLVEALRLDSLRMLTLVMEVENHFHVTLEDGDEAGLEHVEDLVRVLRRRLGG